MGNLNLTRGLSFDVGSTANDRYNRWALIPTLWGELDAQRRTLRTRTCNQTTFVTSQSEAIFPIRYATTTVDEVFKLTVAAPGLSREDFDVTLTKGRNLVVKTVSPEGVENKNEFSFSYQLYDHQDADAISVKMQNGLLELSIPKLTCDPETEVERKIEIDG